MKPLVKCINCEQEHVVEFIEYDLIGDAWCNDCMIEVINDGE